MLYPFSIRCDTMSASELPCSHDCQKPGHEEKSLIFPDALRGNFSMLTGRKHVHSENL